MATFYLHFINNENFYYLKQANRAFYWIIAYNQILKQYRIPTFGIAIVSSTSHQNSFRSYKMFSIELFIEPPLLI